LRILRRQWLIDQFASSRLFTKQASSTPFMRPEERETLLFHTVEGALIVVSLNRVGL